MRFYYNEPHQGYSYAKVLKVGSRLWRVEEPFVTPYVTVPPGFYSDGASIPRFFWSMTDPAGELFEAALAHDFMYSRAIKTKADADKTFKMIALDFGVKPWKANLAYLFVKLFGKGKY
jgi:hypothetical protein